MGGTVTFITLLSVYVRGTLHIKMHVCVCSHLNKCGQMNLCHSLSSVSIRKPLSSTNQYQVYIVSMFHHIYTNTRHPSLKYSLESFSRNDSFLTNYKFLMTTTTFQIYFKTTMWSNSISQIDIFSHNNHTCNKKCNEKGVSSGESRAAFTKIAVKQPVSMIRARNFAWQYNKTNN